MAVEAVAMPPPTIPPDRRDTAPLDRFALLKGDVLDLLDGLTGVSGPNWAMTRELHAKLKAERFNLATVGEFKRGKTCLVNALLGEALLPMGVTPLTSVATVVSHGPAFAATVRFLNGTERPIERAELAEFVTESGNPGNAKQVREVRVDYPATLLRNGLRLLDTPGVGSIHSHNSAAARAVLPDCDAALFVLSADQPLSQAELDFLAEVRGHAQRVFFVLNKIDYLSGSELDAALAFSRATLADALGEDVRVFPVSARQGLKGGGWMDAGLREQSRLPALIAALEEFLLADKGRVLLRGTLAATVRLLDAARLEVGVARQALAETPEDLEARLLAFRRRRGKLGEARRRLLLDFEARAGVAAEAVLDPGLRMWRREQEIRLRRRFQARAEAGAAAPPRPLDADLSAHIAADVADAAARLASILAPELSEELARSGRLLESGVNALLDELQGYAADLFQLDAPAPQSDATELPPVRALLDFETDPAGLSLLSEFTLRDAPAWLGRHFPRIESLWLRWMRRRVVERRRAELMDAIDLVHGRVRNDWLIHLETARHGLAAAVLRRYEAVADGIDLVLTRGLAERRRGAEYANWRRQLLDRQLAQLDRSRQRLEVLRREVDAV